MGCLGVTGTWDSGTNATLDLSQETKEVTGGTNRGLIWQGQQGP